MRYKHQLQKTNICCSCCISIVLNSIGIDMSQDKIAFEMGSHVFEKDLKEYDYPLKTTENAIDLGLSLIDFEGDKPNQLAEKFNLPLSFSVVKDVSVKEFLVQNLEKGNHIIANFYQKPCFPERDFPHTVLVDGFDKETRIVTFCDTFDEKDQFWTAHVDKLQEGISDKLDGKKRGFILIEVTNNTN